MRAAALTILGTLVTTFEPVGPDVYDLFLVAQVQTHDIATICTYNVADFTRVGGIEALTPEAVAARYAL